MSVRAAQFVDIPSIVKIMERAHARSRYGRVTTFDEVEAKQLLVRCIQRHGQQNYMGSLVMVSVRANQVAGFCIGILDQVYPCLKELKATDLLFIFEEEGADPNDAQKMLLALTEWARNNPKVVEVVLGVTDAISSWRRVGKLYERAGLERCGAFYRTSFDRQYKKAEGL